MQYSDDEIRAWLLGLEMELMQPEVRRNRTRVDALLDPEFVEIGASGRLWSRQQILDLLASTQHYEPPQIADFQLRILTPPTAPQLALVTYRTLSTQRGVVLRSSLWRRHDAQWRCLFHQGTVQNTVQNTVQDTVQDAIADKPSHES